MEKTVYDFLTMHGAAAGLFNSLGAINPAKDACFYGVNKAVLARQMLTLADRLQTDDTSDLLNVMREIYGQVEREVANGLDGSARPELVEVLVSHYAR